MEKKVLKTHVLRTWLGTSTKHTVFFCGVLATTENIFDLFPFSVSWEFYDALCGRWKQNMQIWVAFLREIVSQRLSNYSRFSIAFAQRFYVETSLHVVDSSYLQFPKKNVWLGTFDKHPRKIVFLKLFPYLIYVIHCWFHVSYFACHWKSKLKEGKYNIARRKKLSEAEKEPICIWIDVELLTLRFVSNTF